MKKLILILGTSFLFSALISATALAADDWTEVVATTMTWQSPQYRDILIHNPGTYSEVKVMFTSDDAIVDRFDVVSTILWAKPVSGLDGYYQQNVERTGFMNSTKVRWVRIYARPKHAGLPLSVRVWMR